MGFCGGFDHVWLGDVERDRNHASVPLHHQICQGFGVAGRGIDLSGTSGEKFLDKCPANATVGAGDEGNFTFDSAHFCFSWWVGWVLGKYIAMGMRLILAGSDLAFMLAAGRQRTAALRAL
jgi:hypothetical protein